MGTKNRSPKIGLFDIETSPIEGRAWGVRETDLVYIDRPSHLMSFAFKWLGEEKITARTLYDYPGYVPGRKRPHDCDRLLAKDLHQFLSEADVIVAHNGDQFDIKKTNTRLVTLGFDPPSPYKSFDTLKAVRQSFRFDSNKLNNLSQSLGFGEKIANTGIHLWVTCLDGDPSSWRGMKRYNRHDVVLLEKLYLTVRPWAKNHPNLNAYSEEASACPSCQSKKIQRRGVSVAQKARFQRFHCQSCGHWFKGSRVK